MVQTPVNLERGKKSKCRMSKPAYDASLFIHARHFFCGGNQTVQADNSKSMDGFLHLVGPEKVQGPAKANTYSTYHHQISDTPMK